MLRGYIFSVQSEISHLFLEIYFFSRIHNNLHAREIFTQFIKKAFEGFFILFALLSYVLASTIFHVISFDRSESYDQNILFRSFTLLSVQVKLYHKLQRGHRLILVLGFCFV